MIEKKRALFSDCICLSHFKLYGHIADTQCGFC